MDLFNENYFINGAESNYINYPDRNYAQLAKDIKEILQLKNTDLVLDYGCATGNLIRYLKNYCICLGTDISDWAINYGREKFNLVEELFFYNKNLITQKTFDYVIMLDVLEHCKIEEINDILFRIKNNPTIKNIVVRIPVTKEGEFDFVLECSRKDKTHIQKQSKKWWMQLFYLFDFEIDYPINKEKIYDSEGVLAWKLRRK